MLWNREHPIKSLTCTKYFYFKTSYKLRTINFPMQMEIRLLELQMIMSLNIPWILIPALYSSRCKNAFFDVSEVSHQNSDIKLHQRFFWWESLKKKPTKVLAVQTESTPYRCPYCRSCFFFFLWPYFYGLSIFIHSFQAEPSWANGKLEYLV